MVFSHFRVDLVIRISLLTLSLVLLVLALLHTLVAVSLVLVTLVLFQLVTLVRRLESGHRQMASYLTALACDDNSQQFNRLKHDASFNEFGLAMQQLSQHFKQSRHAHEQQSQFLNTVLQQSESALLVIDNNDKIRLCNRACKNLLGCTGLTDLSQLTELHPKLVDFLASLASPQKGLLALMIDQQPVQLLVHKTNALYQSQAVRIITLHNIQFELEQREQEAWQKLVKVLTHEMANSIAPIASLSSVANGLVLNQPELDSEDWQDLQLAIATIHNRSTGLMGFIDSYRDLSKLQSPTFEVIPLRQLFAQLTALFTQKSAVEFHYRVEPESLQIHGDKGQIEQALVNLISNALDALVDVPAARIELSAALLVRGKIEIRVSDNGCGILADVKQRLFIPFFTTKPQGSGIGLALCKQIVQNHGGSIDVQSTAGQGSCFKLIFKL